ncbi:MAG: hypothetical protein K0B15_17000 [Lentimicrobium sp.]|nr:hypothetical protein [Lentimicrobium sp.]
MKTKLIYIFPFIAIMLVASTWETNIHRLQEPENEPVLDLMDGKSVPQGEKQVFVQGAALHLVFFRK